MAVCGSRGPEASRDDVHARLSEGALHVRVSKAHHAVFHAVSNRTKAAPHEVRRHRDPEGSRRLGASIGSPRSLEGTLTDEEFGREQVRLQRDVDPLAPLLLGEQVDLLERRGEQRFARGTRLETRVEAGEDIERERGLGVADDQLHHRSLRPVIVALTGLLIDERGKAHEPLGWVGRASHDAPHRLALPGRARGVDRVDDGRDVWVVLVAVAVGFEDFVRVAVNVAQASVGLGVEVLGHLDARDDRSSLPHEEIWGLRRARVPWQVRAIDLLDGAALFVLAEAHGHPPGRAGPSESTRGLRLDGRGAIACYRRWRYAARTAGAGRAATKTRKRSAARRRSARPSRPVGAVGDTAATNMTKKKVKANGARPKVSSAASTGGAGTFFEQQVDAYLLALLLVRAPAPVLVDAALHEVHFQTKHAGWNTDDFLVCARTSAGVERRLAGQVKRTLTVSRNDEDFSQTIQGAWTDYHNPSIFAPERDRIAIVTLRGTEALQVHFNALLDCARASRDASDFEHRLVTPGFLDQKVQKHHGEVRAIIEAQQDSPVEPEDLLRFLRVLHLVVVDLTSSSSQTEVLVKGLLAHTATEDPLASANATWSALLELVGNGGMPQARAFGHGDLPEDLRRRHHTNGAYDRVLQALTDHSTPILGNIRDVVGSSLVRVARDRLATAILAATREHQLVLVTGPSGAGKSALARSAVDQLRPTHFTLAFRAEEFARPHLDETLQAAQVPASAAQLSAILAGQDHKVVFIDSAERLLESATRDAFADLLELARRDCSWRLLVCCRDYSCNDIRAVFLERVGVSHTVVRVDDFDEHELEQVEAQLPALARVLSVPTLRRLLRNPFYLDLASRLSWPLDQPTPEDARALRQRFWREVVRRDSLRENGLPQRREEAFVRVALDRARALTPYVSTRGLDAGAANSLEQDNLLAFSPSSRLLAAPSHDVLEDWALLQWIESMAVECSYSLQHLANEIGGHPALRRSYKRFLLELGTDSSTTTALFEQATSPSDVPAFVRDDTLATLLIGPHGPDLLTAHTSRLLADRRALLHRVLHLLRVACVAPVDWLDQSAHAPIFYGPAGLSWPGALAILRANLSQLNPDLEAHLVLNFIEDWARGVSWRTPYPPGSQDAAALAYWLLEHFSDAYDSREAAGRVLAILVKIPGADPESFLSLAREKNDRGRSTTRADALLDRMLNGLEGAQAARDMPGEVLALARARWLLPEPTPNDRDEHRWRRPIAVEPLFGLDESTHCDFTPASSYRGPFQALLRHHPSQGLAFILELNNRCAEWYANPRYPHEHVEAPGVLSLSFTDRSTVTQWSSPRLWNLYRGASVGPYLLQCALMALEHWLLQRADAGDDKLEEDLLRLLRDSISVATTAVIASVATAHPHRAGEALLVLLRSPECFSLDRMRCAQEAGTGALVGLLSALPSHDQIFGTERSQSAQREHRQRDLHLAALNAQLGPLRPRVFEILDQHRARISATPGADDAQKDWRLALDQMDLRRQRFKRVDSVALPAERSEPTGTAAQQVTGFVLAIDGLAPDLQAMIDASAAERAPLEAEIGLHVWGVGVYERKQGPTSDPSTWRARLSQARVPRAGSLPYPGLSDGRPYVAAVCVRDRWEELGEDERAWCVETIATTIAAGHARRGALRTSRDFLTGTKESAWVVALLLTRPLPGAMRARTVEALGRALTHPVEEVVYAACNSIGEHLWGSTPELARRCADAVALQGRLLDTALRARPRRSKRGRFDELQAEDESRFDQLEAETVPSTIACVVGESDAARGECSRHTAPAGWVGVHTLAKLLLIYRKSPHDPEAHRLYSLAARTLEHSWERDREADHNGPDMLPREVLSQLPIVIARFAFRAPATEALQIFRPFVAAMDTHPREAASALRWLLLAEESQEEPSSFWDLWQAFADVAPHAGWHRHLREQSAEHGLLRTLFLGLAIEWQPGAQRWPRVDGQEHRLHALANALPPSAAAFEAYVGFFYALGARSLPQGFVNLADRLREQTSVQLAYDSTVFMLEAILRRYVYGRPHEVKRAQRTRDAALFLLDALVERGSSVAYRMRDDLVTPLPT